jgi:hypothetical protein
LKRFSVRHFQWSLYHPDAGPSAVQRAALPAILQHMTLAGQKETQLSPPTSSIMASHHRGQHH